jgi:hypothetical protein
MEQNNSVGTKRYIVLFSLTYAGLFALVNVLAHGFNIDIGSGANIGMFIGASSATAIWFVNANKRAPSGPEKKKLIWGCLASSFAISIAGASLVVYIVFGGQGLTEILALLGALHFAIWLLILFAVTLLYYWLLRLTFGWQANMFAKKYVAEKQA